MTSSQSTYTGRLIHILVWTVVLSMPLFSTSPDRPLMNGQEYLRFLIIPLSFMIVFYINYFILINRLLVRHRMVAFIIANIVLTALIMTIVHLVFRYVLPPDMHRPPRVRPFMDALVFFMRNALMYFLVTGASVAVRMTGGWYRAEAARKELEHRQAEAELQNLRSQVNPHFLFNTLNNIYSLIQIDSVRAQTAVHNLSHLLRYVLYGGNRPAVPVDDEIHFIQEYVDLMRLRLPHNVDVTVSLPGPSGIMIAPLLFIPLVENAFKHGISNDKPSFVHITVSIGNDCVDCTVSNSICHKTESPAREGTGIGLDNLHRRLEMLYPGRYLLQYGPEGNTFNARLNIRLIQ
ncbi:MAG TPA: histidine kinase [Candidatus Coprenecus stercoravium]|uniref:Histidine kinase n=1 Tax=Candidatus Coprenecus stercoravium TaxID=2840735 RepID=A0A9D2GQA8_9BACT|nr:histidine kinase [Candidatus Coprenecus stercoravium]